MFEGPKSENLKEGTKPADSPEKAEAEKSKREKRQEARQERREAREKEGKAHEDEEKKADEDLKKDLEQLDTKEEESAPKENELPGVEGSNRFGGAINTVSLLLARPYLIPGKRPTENESWGTKWARKAVLGALQFTSGLNPKWVMHLSTDPEERAQKLKTLEDNLGMHVEFVGPDRNNPENIKITWKEVTPRVDTTFSKNMESAFGAAWETEMAEVWADLKPETTLKEAEAMLEGKTGEASDQAKALIASMRTQGVKDEDAFQSFLENTQLTAVKLEEDMKKYEGTTEERKEDSDETDQLIKEISEESVEKQKEKTE